MNVFANGDNESSTVIRSSQPPPGLMFVSSADLAQLLILWNRAHAFPSSDSKQAASFFH